jgi:hypothetical protein
MTWPARTWTTAELVTASIMNSYVRDPLADLHKRTVLVMIGDPIGPVLSVGNERVVPIPFLCNVVGWELYADAAGDIVLDVRKDTYAAFPPTAGDSIAGSEKPTLVAVQKNQDLALTTWTPLIAGGSVLAAVIESCTGIRCITLALRLELAS